MISPLISPPYPLSDPNINSYGNIHDKLRGVEGIVQFSNLCHHSAKQNPVDININITHRLNIVSHRIVCALANLIEGTVSYFSREFKECSRLSVDITSDYRFKPKLKVVNESNKILKLRKLTSSILQEFANIFHLHICSEVEFSKKHIGPELSPNKLISFLRPVSFSEPNFTRLVMNHMQIDEIKSFLEKIQDNAIQRMHFHMSCFEDHRMYISIKMIQKMPLVSNVIANALAQLIRCSFPYLVEEFWSGHLVIEMTIDSKRQKMTSSVILKDAICKEDVRSQKLAQQVFEIYTEISKIKIEHELETTVDTLSLVNCLLDYKDKDEDEIYVDNGKFHLSKKNDFRNFFGLIDEKKSLKTMLNPKFTSDPYLNTLITNSALYTRMLRGEMQLDPKKDSELLEIYRKHNERKLIQSPKSIFEDVFPTDETFPGVVYEPAEIVVEPRGVVNGPEVVDGPDQEEKALNRFLKVCGKKTANYCVAAESDHNPSGNKMVSYSEAAPRDYIPDPRYYIPDTDDVKGEALTPSPKSPPLSPPPGKRCPIIPSSALNAMSPVTPISPPLSPVSPNARPTQTPNFKSPSRTHQGTARSSKPAMGRTARKLSYDD